MGLLFNRAFLTFVVSLCNEEPAQLSLCTIQPNLTGRVCIRRFCGAREQQHQIGSQMVQR